MKCHRVWLSGLAALAALPAAAKVDDPNDLIQGRWYATEVIIFERTKPADPGPEELVWEGGRTWPATARAFAEPKPWRIASLDPLTRACLEFPRLDVIPTTTTPAQCPEAQWSGGEMEGASQQPNRGRDALAPGMAPVPCLSMPPSEATTPSGTAPPEPVALEPPPAIEPSLAPHPLLDLLRAAARQQEAWRRDSYRWLPEGTHLLKAQARRIRNAQGLNVVWHGRWMQPVPSRSAGEPLMLDLPATADHGRVSGTLAVTLGRFLHFNAMLWLEEADDGRDGLVPFMQLSEARTMRLGELHYLDHPRLGVLVQIDRVPPSPALARALQAWETSANG